MTQMDTTASFGYWIRRQRMALDMTQADFARQVGCATVTISKIERDERRPSRQMAGLLAEHLAIPEDERERFLSVAMGEESVVRMPVKSEPVSDGKGDTPSFSSIPNPTTPFIGRSADLHQLAQNLENPDCRLLSMVGPGGFGKTRLAIQLGKIFEDRDDLFPDGVFFVALDGVESADAVVSTIAAALQLTFVEQKDQETLLLDFLVKKQLLLIMDNAERILEPELVNKILSHSANVIMLITSREALQLQQEWFYSVEGMQVEEIQDDDKLIKSDAVDLFDVCAQRARSNFDLKVDLDHVLAICRLVDGVPLAIELAAAWIKVLPCAQIVDELERSLDILSTSFRNIPERHRNVRAVLEQTWAFLSDDEQRVFRQLSVFAGGFQLEAAQQVADASLMMLATLVEKSVLQLGQNGRYRIHALLRQFGAEKLDELPDELLEIQLRHSDFFLYFLQERNESITGKDQKVVLEEVDAEFDNIRVAWNSAANMENLGKLDKALPCLFRYLWTRGRYENGKQLMLEVLSCQNITVLNSEDSLAYVRLQARQAQFCGIMGSHDEALALTEEALSVAQKAEALPEQALCYYAAGLTWRHQNNRENSLENLNHAYRIYTKINDIAGLAQTSLTLGYVNMHHAGDYATGCKRVEEGLQLSRRLEDLSSIAQALNEVSLMDCAAGNYGAAEAGYRECIEVAKQVGNQQAVAQGIGGLGLVAWGREEWDRSLKFLFERLEIMQKIGHAFMVQENLHLICGVYAYSGRYDEAVDLISSHGLTWRNFFTAEAHIGAGQFSEAINYLPKETESQVTTKNRMLLASYLLPWSMLLLSECSLVQVTSNNEDSTVRWNQAERKTKAVEILSFLSIYQRCRCDTRQRAAALLNKIETNTTCKSDLTQTVNADQTLEEFAKEMLSIRLG